MERTAYNSSFFSTYAGDSLSSAREVLSIVKDMANPQSVVDVGCGIGTWLKAWMDLGVNEVVGIDGSYVKADELLIPRDRFRAMDLSAPVKLGTRFDLVQSLEVAEHLPETSAKAFVSFLCSLGDVVLFSAAIPFQGGTSHINEQWPEYWAQLFMSHGFVTVDVVRELVWNNDRVAYYYAQNTFLFVRPEKVGSLKLPIDNNGVQPRTSLSKVHPRKWIEKNTRPLGLKQAIAMLPRSGVSSLRRVFHRIRQATAGKRKNA